MSLRARILGAPIPTGERTMKQIQHWFDRLVGVAAEEARLRQLAHDVFRHDRADFAALESPACWRRAARVGHPRRAGPAIMRTSRLGS